MAHAGNSQPEIDRFEERLRTVGTALDEFARFDRPDPVTRLETWTKRLDQPLPQDGLGADAAVKELLEVVVPNGARGAEPGFWGFVTTGPTTVGVTAASAALLASPQRGSLTAFNHLEELSLNWLGELCGLGPHMLGVYSSGGSTANLVALGAARQWALEQEGIDAAAAGLDGRKVAIYGSTEAHHTIQRAAAALGLGRDCFRSIEVDDQQRIVPSALASAVAADRAEGVLPIAVVANAGTTNTGAIDDIRACGEIARSAGAWLHVDGAYGLPGIVDPRISELFDGLELADSVIVDPHKWLAAPVGVAATFVRDRSVLHRAFTQQPAEYLEGFLAGVDVVKSSLDSLGVPYHDFGVELSAPPRGVLVWAILLEEGRNGLQQRIMRDNDFARRVSEYALHHPRLQSLIEPQLSVAGIRYVPEAVENLDDFNSRLLRRLIHETRFLPSSTMVGGAFAIRPCFINPRTSAKDVELFLETLVELGDELATDSMD